MWCIVCSLCICRSIAIDNFYCMDCQALQLFVALLSSRNLSKLDSCRLIGQSVLKPQAIVSPRQQVKSKLSLQIWYATLCFIYGTLCTLRCDHPPPPWFFLCPLRSPPPPPPISSATSFSWPECGHNLPESGARTNWLQHSPPFPSLLLLARHAPFSSAPCHICDAEANVLCPCAAASQRQFMAPYRGRQQRKRLIKFNNFVKC